LRVPIFTGVWPLFSSREAEFSAYGMQVAEKIIAAALGYFPDVYLITPFLHYEATTELAKFARSL